MGLPCQGPMGARPYYGPEAIHGAKPGARARATWDRGHMGPRQYGAEDIWVGPWGWGHIWSRAHGAGTVGPGPWGQGHGAGTGTMAAGHGSGGQATGPGKWNRGMKIPLSAPIETRQNDTAHALSPCFSPSMGSVRGKRETGHLILLKGKAASIQL